MQNAYAAYAASGKRVGFVRHCAKGRRFKCHYGVWRALYAGFGSGRAGKAGGAFGKCRENKRNSFAKQKITLPHLMGSVMVKRRIIRIYVLWDTAGRVWDKRAFCPHGKSFR